MCKCALDSFLPFLDFQLPLKNKNKKRERERGTLTHPVITLVGHEHLWIWSNAGCFFNIPLLTSLKNCDSLLFCGDSIATIFSNCGSVFLYLCAIQTGLVLYRVGEGVVDSWTFWRLTLTDRFCVKGKFVLYVYAHLYSPQTVVLALWLVSYWNLNQPVCAYTVDSWWTESVFLSLNMLRISVIIWMWQAMVLWPYSFLNWLYTWTF